MFPTIIDTINKNNEFLPFNTTGRYLLSNRTNALYFNGASYVVALNYMVSQTFSIFLWFNQSVSPITSNTLYSLYNEAQTSSTVIEVKPGNVLTFTCNNGTATVKLEYTIDTGIWYNLVAVHTSKGIALYINGTCVGVNDTPLVLDVSTAGYKTIGCNVDHNYFTGYLKNLMIFNSFLFTNCIQKLYYLTYIQNNTGPIYYGTPVTGSAILDIYVAEESILDPIPTPPPVAEFTADILSGECPLTITFTDQSIGTPTTWAWHFNGDATPDTIVQNPSYTFNTAGVYNVTLVVTNAGGSDELTKNNYITISEPVPGPVTLYPTYDTWIWEDSPTTSYGSSTTLTVGDGGALECNALIQFNISSITRPVTSATLRCYQIIYPDNYYDTRLVTIKRFTSIISASTTWNNKPIITSTGQFNYAVPDQAGWFELDVTNLINASSDLFGIMFDMNDPYMAIGISSLESSNKPELIITP